jgi:hypothetical protein
LEFFMRVVVADQLLTEAPQMPVRELAALEAEVMVLLH